MSYLIGWRNTKVAPQQAIGAAGSVSVSRKYDTYPIYSSVGGGVTGITVGAGAYVNQIICIEGYPGQATSNPVTMSDGATLVLDGQMFIQFIDNTRLFLKYEGSNIWRELYRQPARRVNIQAKLSAASLMTAQFNAEGAPVIFDSVLRDAGGCLAPPKANITGVTFTSRKIVSVTLDNATDIFTAAGHGFTAGQRVNMRAATYPTRVGGGSTGQPLPSYYIKYIDVNTFQLEDSVGGGAIDWTSNGTTITIGHCRCTKASHGLSNGDWIYFPSQTGLPTWTLATFTGIKAMRPYMVIDSDVNTFMLTQVSSTTAPEQWDTDGTNETLATVPEVVIPVSGTYRIDIQTVSTRTSGYVDYLIMQRYRSGTWTSIHGVDTFLQNGWNDSMRIHTVEELLKGDKLRFMYAALQPTPITTIYTATLAAITSPSFFNARYNTLMVQQIG